jgi:hypothetical protein
MPGIIYLIKHTLWKWFSNVIIYIVGKTTMQRGFMKLDMRIHHTVTEIKYIIQTSYHVTTIQYISLTGFQSYLTCIFRNNFSTTHLFQCLRKNYNIIYGIARWHYRLSERNWWYLSPLSTIFQLYRSGQF